MDEKESRGKSEFFQSLSKNKKNPSTLLLYFPTNTCFSSHIIPHPLKLENPNHNLLCFSLHSTPQSPNTRKSKWLNKFYDLPCEGEGICMACKNRPTAEESLTCKTCATPWHVTCLSVRPSSLADTLQWNCPDCSLLSANPVSVSGAGES